MNNACRICLERTNTEDHYHARCVRAIFGSAKPPKLKIDIQKFYRLLVFVWWSGNGDKHLKNVSLLVDGQGVTRLTPAYDLVCTRWVIPNNPRALSLMGKKDNLDRQRWIALADYCHLPGKALVRVPDAKRPLYPRHSASSNAVSCLSPNKLSTGNSSKSGPPGSGPPIPRRAESA